MLQLSRTPSSDPKYTYRTQVRNNTGPHYYLPYQGPLPSPRVHLNHTGVLPTAVNTGRAWCRHQFGFHSRNDAQLQPARERRVRQDSKATKLAQERDVIEGQAERAQTNPPRGLNNAAIDPSDGG